MLVGRPGAWLSNRVAMTPMVSTNAAGSGNPFAIRAPDERVMRLASRSCVRGYVAAYERPAVALGRSNLKWGDHRLKVPCNDYFGAQGTDHQTPWAPATPLGHQGRGLSQLYIRVCTRGA